MKTTTKIALIATCLTRLATPAVGRGSEFELAASASQVTPLTTHLAHSDSTTFPVYLWVSAATAGVATLHAVVVSDFTLSMFDPAEGISSFGSLDTLKLAIGGAHSAPFVLGQWQVSLGAGDSSGALCMFAPNDTLPSCDVSDSVQLGNPAGYVASVIGFALGDSVSCTSQ